MAIDEEGTRKRNFRLCTCLLVVRPLEVRLYRPVIRLQFRLRCLQRQIVPLEP